METQKCVICGKASGMRCGRCHAVAYCSGAHQRDDWKRHKTDCKLYAVKKSTDPDDAFPLSCVATGNMNPGTIILEESSIFHFPNAVEGYGARAPPNKTVTVRSCSCVTCGNEIYFPELKGSKEQSCSICGWPVCSDSCEKAPVHANNECKIFSTCKIPRNFIPMVNSATSTAVHYTEIIKIVRAVSMQDKNPELWETLKSIEPPKPNNYSTLESSGKKGTEIVIRDIFAFLQKAFGKASLNSHADFLQEYLIHKGVFSSQGFMSPCEQQLNKRFPDKFTTCLYKEASKFPHDCSPNCFWVIGRAPNFKIRIIAAVPIKRGDALTVSRIQNDSNSHYGTLVRQQLLVNRLGFQCTCKLCLDPTEFGTYISAMVCTVCRDNNEKGFLLPVDPRNLSEENQLWKCDRCERESSASSNLSKLYELSDTLDRQLSGEHLAVFANLSKLTDKTGPELKAEYNSKLRKLCKNIMGKYGDVTLHPNHWILQYAAKCLSHNIVSNMPANLQDGNNRSHKKDPAVFKALQYVIQLESYLLSILDKVMPGIGIQQVYVKNENSNALQRLVGIEMTSSKPTIEQIKEVIKIHEKCIRLKEDLHLYYKCILPPVGQTKESFAKMNDDHLEHVKLLMSILQDDLKRALAKAPPPHDAMLLRNGVGSGSGSKGGN